MKKQSSLRKTSCHSASQKKRSYKHKNAVVQRRNTGYRSMHRQNGSALLDQMFNTVIWMLVLSVVYMLFTTAWSMYLRNAATTQANYIIAQAKSWKTGRGNFTGISMNGLCTYNYLDTSTCGAGNNAQSTNPYGGNWVLTANPSNPGLLNLTLTMPNDANEVFKVADSLAPGTRAKCESSTDCSTLTVAGTTITGIY